MSVEIDVTDIVAAHVQDERKWLSEQPAIKRVTTDWKSGVSVRVSRKKVWVRGVDSSWEDVSEHFPASAPRDHSIEQEHRSVREEDR